MARLLLLLGLAAGLFILFRWLSRQPSRVQWQAAAVGVALVLLVLVLLGRAHWLTAVFAALLPFVRGLIALLGSLPLLKRIFDGVNSAGAQNEPSGGQQSTVQSKYIRMTLNHDSGEIDAEFQDMFLSSLPAWKHVSILLGLAVVVLVIAAGVLSRRQFVGASEA